MTFISKPNYKLPNPQFGKTHKDTRMARLIDLERVVDEVNEEFQTQSTAITNVENNLPTTASEIDYDPTASGLTATDVQAAIDEVVASSGGSDYTETIVTITPTQTTYSDGRPLVASGILAMGTTPIELLPAAGIGMYYDIEKLNIEYTLNNLSYNSPDKFRITGTNIIMSEFVIGGNSQDSFSTYYPSVDSLNELQVVYGINTPITFQSNGFPGPTNPTVGDGTLRVKIYHKTITFGA